MNKDPKTLPQAIKVIVGKYGKDVVNDVQLVNIMNDVVSLEESNAVKSVLRDVIKLGYGSKMSATNTQDFRLKIKTYSSQLSDTYGYKEAIVQYILYSLAFGIGICTQEPSLKSQDFPPPQKNIELSAGNINKMASVVNKKKPYKAIFAIAITLVVGLIWGFSHWSSEQFDERILTGDSFVSSGDYIKAVESYKTAYNNSSILNSGQKDKALEKIESLADKLITEGETNAKCLHLASQALESELQLDLSPEDKSRVLFKKNNLDNKISARLDNGRNTLITILSANKGKLDDSGKQLLEELLGMSSNDYWLNFIRKKSNE